MGVIALAIIGAAGYGMSRVATGFIPIEDQGYLLATVQLPDGAALGRTQETLQQVSEHRQEDAGRRPGGHHRRRLGARQQLDAGQCRRRLHHPQGLEPARQGRGSCLALRRRSTSSLSDIERRPRAGAAAAADPGHRQCGGLHHAGRAARRQLRPRQAAGRDQRAWSRRPRRSPASSASRRRSAPTCRNTGSRSTARRCRALGLTTDQVFSDARRLSRLELRQPVQQVRPRLPDLCAGRRAVPPVAGRDRQPDRAQQERRHDPARHGADGHAERRALADQPLQPLSLGIDRRRARRRASRRATRSS